MPLLDERGRVFGRFNAVDAFVVALVLVLMPMAYASYLLFRSPPAKLNGVEPKQMTPMPNARVRIVGTNLRPFMRVSFGTTQGRTFMIGSTESAEVDLPSLEPGTYDVVLYDYAREVDRLPNALTILPRTPAPTVKVSVGGSFIGLSEANAKAIQAGVKLAKDNQVLAIIMAAGAPRPGEVLIRAGDSSMSVHLPGQFAVQAALELECSLESNGDGSLRCLIYGPLQPSFVGAESVLALPLNGTTVSFQVAEVHPPGPPAFVRVRARAILPPDGAVRVRAGDADSTMPEYAGAWIGRIESVNGSVVTLRLPAQRLASGWKYRAQFLKLGAGLRFESPTAVLNATIDELTPLNGRSE